MVGSSCWVSFVHAGSCLIHFVRAILLYSFLLYSYIVHTRIVSYRMYKIRIYLRCVFSVYLLLLGIYSFLFFFHSHVVFIVAVDEDNKTEYSKYWAAWLRWCECRSVGRAFVCSFVRTYVRTDDYKIISYFYFSTRSSYAHIYWILYVVRELAIVMRV